MGGTNESGTVSRIARPRVPLPGSSLPVASSSRLDVEFTDAGSFNSERPVYETSCLSALDDFRTGRIARTTASVTIGVAISRGVRTDREEKTKLYERYFTLLERIENELRSADSQTPWDEIGLPHDESKQLFGSTLETIGSVVDPNAMTVLFPEDKRSELIQELRTFARSGRRWPLRHFLSIAGWCNWAFNVFYLLPPGLSALYEKVAGKTNMCGCINVNKRMVEELTWMANHLEHLPGVRLLNACAWEPSSDDVVIVHVDAASTTGLGLFFPHLDVGFQCSVQNLPPDLHINFLELLAVCSAVHTASHMHNVPKRLAVFSDSTFAVDIFHSLRARPPFNPIVMSAVDVLISHEIDLRVIHLPGTLNTVADALSRFQNDAVRSLVPDIAIMSFLPPRVALGGVIQ